MERPDGSRYSVHLHFTLVQMPGFRTEDRDRRGGTARQDRRGDRGSRPDLRFDPGASRLLGGIVTAAMGDGSEAAFRHRRCSATPASGGAGLYFGLDGHHHGEWRGESTPTVSGSADCRPRRLHAGCTRSATPPCR
ncbi:MAG: hypothetical protein R2789_19545 [Microthrixaceae bacterium]